MALAIAVHNIPEARASPARLSGASRVSSACTAGRARRRAASGAARRRRDRLLRAQGVIVAAPVYAATGSRWKAMGIAVASVRALPLQALVYNRSAAPIWASRFGAVWHWRRAGPAPPHACACLSAQGVQRKSSERVRPSAQPGVLGEARGAGLEPGRGFRQGLSEPLGALIALLFVKPFLTPLLLHFMLAFVGGIMVSEDARRWVCVALRLQWAFVHACCWSPPLCLCRFRTMHAHAFACRRVSTMP